MALPFSIHRILKFIEINSLKIGERWQYTKMPLEWADSGSVTESMGCVGYLFSGGCVFDHRSGDADDAPLAIYWEGDSLDPYYGHSNNVYQYHYHAVSFKIILQNFKLSFYG